MAAAAIEKVTGDSYQTVLRRDVFEPLGIADAHFIRTEAVGRRLAQGYIARQTATPYVPIVHHPAGKPLTLSKNE